MTRGMMAIARVILLRSKGRGAKRRGWRWRGPKRVSVCLARHWVLRRYQALPTPKQHMISARISRSLRFEY